MELKEEEKKPGYSGKYDADVKQSYDALTKRGKFNYEASADPAYRAYRDSYKREGEQAMRHSMAQAADLTGGYGSSYAQSVGQQQYGEYLKKLSDVMPELYAEAYQRYQQEGELLGQNFNAAAQLAGMDYGRYKDELDRADSKEQFEYKKQQDAYKMQQDAYDNLAELISSTGYMPSAEELQRSGMSAAQAQALSYEFLRRNNLLLLPGMGMGSGSSEVNYYNLSPTSPFDIGYREGMFDDAVNQKLSANK